MTSTVVESDGRLNDLFKCVPVSQFPLPAHGKIFAIPSSASVHEAVKMLEKKNFLCAPVVDPEHPEKFIGVVDQVGLAYYILDTLAGGEHGKTFEEQLNAQEDFGSTPVSKLVDSPRWQPMYSVDKSNSLLEVMLILGKYRCHRLGVMDGVALNNFITQSALINLLFKNLDKFQGLQNATLEELGLASKLKCVTITQKTTAWEAFQTMVKENISAVPVLDPTDKVIGNVSIREARRIISDPSWMELLHKPVTEWLDENVFLVVTAEPDFTLGQVIKQLVESRIHRVFVVDKQVRLVRVLSLRDILTVLVKEPTEVPVVKE
eukprot:m.84643 g.84643  ORF g.84643 m.84643 type:complete len:320 (+) comp21205_c0_seq1:34-993(+)